MSRSVRSARKSAQFVPVGFVGGSPDERVRAAERLAAEQKSLPWVVSVEVQARKGKGIGVRVVSFS